jgi:predicted RNA binding protein YcfA (HicA-like mRNA interferase family)
LKPVSGKRMRKILEGMGWTLQRVRGSHHYFVKDDVPYPVSVPIHGSKTLKPGTKSIMRAANLTDDDL